MRPAMIARRAFAWHEWFVKRIGSVDFDASMAVRGEISTIMIRCSDAARRRPSAQVMASPRISPILRRAGIISAANTPWPSISLLRTNTSNFWYAWRTTTGSAAKRGIASEQAGGLAQRRDGRELHARRRRPALLAVLHHHVGVDAAAHVPLGRDAREARLGGGHDVVEDGVGHLLVERALVAVAPHVHLQALQLDAQLVADHVDGEVREVGLAGQRAVARELGDLELDKVVE